MLTGKREHMRDLLGRDERPRGIMHRNIADTGTEKIQACADRILAMLAAGDNVADLLRSGRPSELLQLRQALGAPNHNDFIHAICALEGVERVGNDRLATEKREKLIEAHPPAAASGDNDGG